MVIWLIGLSGAGKTTVGTELVNLWRKTAPGTVLVDGDMVRAVFAQNQEAADHSIAGRKKNAERMTALCEWLDRQGLNVVCCILSIFPEMRQGHSKKFSRYGEVYLRAQLGNLVARDSKNLYAPAIQGETRNVVGVDIDFPEPRTPDLVFDTDHSEAPAEIARRILDWIEGSV